MHKLYKILVVDEEHYLGQMLLLSTEEENRHLQITNVESASEAIYLLERNDYDAVIIHYQINDLVFTLVKEVKEIKNILPIIIITDRDETEEIRRLKIIESGATFILEKPYSVLEILAIIKNLLALNESYRNLEHNENVIKALTRAIEIKDQYTVGHSEATADMAVKIFDKIGLKGIQRQDLYIGCLLHDIGKIGITDAILNKESSLSREEFIIIASHAELGYNICKDLNKLKDSMNIVLQHHEKLDGSGYPYGLKGEQIDFLAQICTVSDMYNAMTSDRSYRKAMKKEEAINILLRDAKMGKINLYLVQILKKIVMGESNESN